MSIKHLFGLRSLAEFSFRLHYDENEDSRLSRNLFAAPLIPPDFNRVWGFDCSHWSGVVNMATAKQNGAHFVFIKAADGTIPSNYFSQNWAGAKAQNIPRGAYFWLYPNSKVSCKLQARAWWNVIKNDPGELPAVIDFEPTKYGGLPANPNYSDLDLALSEYNAIANRKPLLYSSPGYLADYGKVPQTLVDKFEGLWIAHWDTIPPTVPLNFKTWLFHQYADDMNGQIVGYDPLQAKAADLDYCFSEQVLSNLTGIIIPPSDTPPESDTMITKISTTGVKVLQDRAYESDYQVVIIPHNQIARASFKGTSGREIMPQVVDSDIVINFTPFDPKTYQVNLGLMQSGRPVKSYVRWNPYATWNNDGTCLIDHNEKRFSSYKEASQGFRYIIENGSKNINANSDWNNIEPRQSVGKMANGDTVIITVKGRENSQRGITLHELCQLGLNFQCIYLMDVDSGYSTYTGYRESTGLLQVFTGTPINDPVAIALGIDLVAPLVFDDSTPPDGDDTGQAPDWFKATFPDGSQEFYDKRV